MYTKTQRNLAEEPFANFTPSWKIFPPPCFLLIPYSSSVVSPLFFGCIIAHPVQIDLLATTQALSSYLLFELQFRSVVCNVGIERLKLRISRVSRELGVQCLDRPQQCDTFTQVRVNPSIAFATSAIHVRGHTYTCQTCLSSITRYPRHFSGYIA